MVMGCVMSAEEKAQQQMSRRIDDELAHELAHRRSEVKLLLLGKKGGREKEIGFSVALFQGS